MGEKPASKGPSSFILAPATLEDQHKRRPPVEQPSWWTLWSKWLQYYSIQVRWDIERWLARLFHRRWGA